MRPDRDWGGTPHVFFRRGEGIGAEEKAACGLLVRFIHVCGQAAAAAAGWL